MMVTLHNPTGTLAFGVRLKVKRGPGGRVGRQATGDDEILPVLWEDNYLALLPGETRQVTATYNAKDVGRSTAVVEVEGWNVKTKLIQP